MGRRAAVGIDDDLASGDAGIAVRSANDETAGRIDVKMFLRAHPAVRQNIEDVWTDDLAHRVLVDLAVMLRRDHHRGRPNRLAVHILQRHLAFGVGAEQRFGRPSAGLRPSDFRMAWE